MVEQPNKPYVSNLELPPIKDIKLRDVQMRSFPVWAATAGLKVDHRDFSFINRRFLIDLYKAATENQIISFMKSAQMGATVWLLLFLLYMSVNWKSRINRPIKSAIYFPTEKGVEEMSKDRLQPIIDSNREILSQIKRNTKDDTLSLKRVGQSSLYLRSIGGSVSKDSTPLDIICFDEVRLMLLADIYQTYERTSASELKIRFHVSTAGYPNAEIHKLFKRGDQQFFHTVCQRCGYDFVAPFFWPDGVIAEHKIGPKAGQVYYICPKCRGKIEDMQNGLYVKHNPQSDECSLHVSQLISGTISAKEVWKVWVDAENIKEFYNSKLGLPWIDAENKPVDEAILNECIRTDLVWGGDRRQTCMGVDQKAGMLHVVIAKKYGNERRIVWYEIVESIEPFQRLGQLMKEFDVKVCLLDYMPNTNEAMRFANDHNGRVWLTVYKDDALEMVQWADRHKKAEKFRKGTSEIYQKYKVVLDRYKTIDFSMSLFGKGLASFPPPTGPGALIQTCRHPTTHKTEPQNTWKEHAYLHFQNIVREKNIIDETTGKFRMKWRNLDLDPHTVHAWNYCAIAMERHAGGPRVAWL